MKITMKSITLHNFLSIGDATVTFADKGYCIVKGVNNNPKDAALSNGAGKSTIFSGISYALTGKTIQGLSSNIVNIYGDDGCFVTLDFSVDADDYRITRYKDYAKIGTDLKIFVNGEDRSGKGIRDSQALLDQYLPDLNTDLLGSVIVIGQGMPQKFTNNTPAGRKEVLERLSRSDFMIADLKKRIDGRNLALSTAKRSHEDAILGLNTKIEMYIQQLAQATKELENFAEEPNFNELITLKQETLAAHEVRRAFLQENAKMLTEKLNEANIALSSKKSKDNEVLAQLTAKYQAEIQPIEVLSAMRQGAVKTLQEEITKLKSIKEVCPTCGQKILGVEKPHTHGQEEELNKLQQEIVEIKESLQKSAQQHNAEMENQRRINSEQLSALQEEVTKISQSLSLLASAPNDNVEYYSSQIIQLNNEITNLLNDKNNFNNKKNEIQARLTNLNTTKEEASAQLKEQLAKKDDVQLHLDLVAKMRTAIQRDFRGFLLSSVIDYINHKAKEYSKDVFGTDELVFELDGNNINISYLGKAFENLSGGEKQRVDLIIQFAIRDMMSQYLSFTSNILVLDEIFDGLDILGTTNVLNLIAKKLTDVESVFIISHNESLEIPYDSILTVVKNEEGISSIR